MRMVAALLLLSAGALAASSCASPECRAQVDRCLQSCPPEPTLPEDAKRPGDTRDDCERRCQQKCRW
jgi:hypothetical protein